ncbi:MAG: glycosyltransferase [Lysobacter sp.]|nr:glycosyltransferase [Lysobacter sp.]
MAWDDPRPLPANWLQHPASRIAGDAIAAVIEREFQNSPLWAIKDPRLCRFVPLWRDVLQRAGIEPRALIVTRNPVEVAQSLSERNDLPAGVGELLWATYTQEAEEGSRGLRRSLVDYQDLLDNWNATMSRLSADLGMDLQADQGVHSQVEAFLSTSLRHHRASGSQVQGFVAPLFEATQQSTPSGTALDTIAKQASALQADLQPFLPAISGLSEMVASERQRLAAMQEEASTIARALVESTAWGASRNEELTRIQAQARALLQEVEKSTAWGASRDVELRKALARTEALQAELAESTKWGSSRDLELHKVLERAEALQAELAESTAWGSSRDLELRKVLERAEALHAELTASIAWSDSRDNELRKVTVTLESVLLQRNQLEDDLRETAREMEQLNALIRQDLQNLRDEVHARASSHDIEITIAKQALIQKQHEVDGLQHQTNLLYSRVAALEHRLYTAGFINGARRTGVRLVGAAKQFVKFAIKQVVFSWPGTPERKQVRIQQLRSLNETRNSGSNSASILSDLHALAVDRWPACPAYRVRAGIEAKLVELDISVVVYNSEQWVDGFMESLLTSDYPLDKIKLHIRDHSPGSGTRLAFERFVAAQGCPFAGYMYSSGRNVGFGGGHNYNFRQSRAEYFLVCNVDGRFQPDALRVLLLATATSDEKVAAWELRQTPYEHPKYYDPVTMLTTWVSGACALFRREAYREVGGFDDLIFMYGEDVDLSYRLRGRGYQLAYVPRAVFQHDSYAEPAQFKPLQFHGSSLANMLLRLRFGTLSDLLAIPGMWRELGRSARQQNAYRGFLRSGLKLVVLGPLFLLSRYRRGSARIPFMRWDYGLRRAGAFEAIAPTPVSLPLVSIIVRTFRGRGDLLRQALASIANQSYSEIEVIVVEDKGAEMQGVAESCASTFGLDLKYLSCANADSNRCVTGNLGLKIARGEYANFLDDDDLLFADHVEYLVSRLHGRTELGACYALAWETKIATDPDSGRYQEVLHSSLPRQRVEFDRALLQVSNYIPIQAVLFRRSLYERYGGFNPKLDNLEDWDLWRRYSWTGDFRMCPKTTSLYHVPADFGREIDRQMMLDRYYEIAKRESDAACEAIDHG